ncbi:MAG: site-2 protease family protein [Eubacteriales bacterium]|nr:site-2 protease family protein [Eubacteriales bacterium]
MQILTTILYVVLALLSLCIMIVVHELGHYTVGRLLGFRILEFSVGFGKALWQKEKNGILYSVRLIPLGGFCKFLGEDDADDPEGNKTAGVEGAMNEMPAWKRVLVLAAGVTFNLLFALIVAVGMFGVTGTVATRVDEVVAGSPADGVLQTGDMIVRVEDGFIFSGGELSAAIASRDTVRLTVDRGGETLRLTVSPQITTDEEGNTVRRVGVSIRTGTYHRGLGETLSYAFGYCGYVLDSIVSTFEGLFTGSIGLDKVGGPVTTVTEMVRLEREFGVTVLIELMVLISLNLALFNILPFPALDGARILFVVIYAVAEKIAGRKLSHKAEAYIHAAGLIILFGFIVVIEVLRLIKLF